MAGRPKLSLVPQSQVVELHDNAELQSGLLVNRRTGETKRLVGNWCLHCTPEGVGYLAPRDGKSTTQWVSALLGITVFVAPSGEEWVRHEVEGRMVVELFATLRERRKPDVRVRVDVPPHKVVDASVVVWLLPRKGERVWWYLPALHEELQLSCQKGSARKWCSHGWSRWEAFLEESGLGKDRMILQMTKNDGLSNLGVQSTQTERLFSQKSASSIALLALLSKWSSTDGHHAMRSDIDRALCFWRS